MTVRLQPRPIGDTWRFFMREMSGDVGVDLSVYSDISCQIRIASTRALFATPAIVLADQTSALTRGSYELRVDAATTEGAAKGLYIFDVQVTDSLGIVTTLHVPPLEFEAVVDVTKLAADPPVSPPPTFTGDGTRLLMRSPLGVYTSIRIEPAGTAAPTVTDDAAHGYAAGSWWLYAGDMWRCRDATTGAAVWVMDVVASDALPQAGGTASAGVSALYARGDHVHPQPAPVSVSASASVGAASAMLVDTSAGDVTLTLPEPSRQHVTIKKTSTDTSAIILAPHSAAPSIEGGAAGASMLLDASARGRSDARVVTGGADWWVTESAAPFGPFALAEGALHFQSKPAPVTSGDYASVPGALVPDAGPWTIAFYYAPTTRFSAGGILAAKWDAGAGARGWAIERFGDGVIVWFGNSGNFAYTLDTLFVAGVEREIAIAFNGGGATPADRIKVFSRLTGGTWVAHTLSFGGTVPVSIFASGAPVTIARATGGTSAASANFRLRDFRILNAAVTPSGTSSLSLSGLTARWRFRTIAGMTTRDEVASAPMTLTHTLGGALRPARTVYGWRAGTLTGRKKVHWIGNSKTSGSAAARGAARYEACNQLAAVWGMRPDFVGRYVDSGGQAEFLYNAQHSGLGGALLSGDILTRCTDDVITYAPDVVILEGGTNDVFGGASAATTRDRMGACIDAVLAASATARVIVISDPAISAITHPTEYATLVTFNGLLPALVAGKGPRVSFVDVFPLTCEDYLWDPVHMLEPGYARIAEPIAAEIARLLA